MNNKQHPELLNRHIHNPVLTIADWPYPDSNVFNPGAIVLQDGTTLHLCRIEDRRGHSHLCAARFANGLNDWKIDLRPTLYPDTEHFPEELWGIEDPRITPDCGIEKIRDCLHRFTNHKRPEKKKNMYVLQCSQPIPRETAGTNNCRQPGWKDIATCEDLELLKAHVKNADRRIIDSIDRIVVYNWQQHKTHTLRRTGEISGVAI